MLILTTLFHYTFTQMLPTSNLAPPSYKTTSLLLITARNTVQRNYTTTKKEELLATVMTLTTYQKLLMGTKIYIYTDHKNLTFKTFSLRRILCWQLFVDQFDRELRYIPGKENVLADCFSRLPLMEKPSVGTSKQHCLLVPTEGFSTLLKVEVD